MSISSYFGLFLEYKQKQGVAEHTLLEYRRFLGIIEPAIGRKYLWQLKRTDREEVMALGAQHGYWGAQRAVSTLVNLLKFLEYSGKRLPFRSSDIMVPRVDAKEQFFLLPDQFEAFMEKLPDTFYGLRDRLLYELLWSTGVRIGEALAINVKDIDFEHRIITVQTEKHGEGNKVYISDRLEYWLKEWLKQRSDQNPALFIIYNLGVRRLTPCMTRKNLDKYRTDLELPWPLTHRAFRSGFCNYVLNSEANIKEAQYLMRHRSPRTTLMWYAKVVRGQVSAVHQRIFSKLFEKRKSKGVLEVGV